MTGNDNNPIARGEHVTEMLSAYIDGTLEATERDSVRAHLEGCVNCRADHAELLATRAMLRAVPAMQAPRAFTLTPEMAREARPPSLFERIFVPANAPRMATASVLSFVLLFFVLVGPQFASSFSPAPASFSKIGYGLATGDGPAPSERQQDQDTAITMGGQAEPTATMGTAAEAFSAPVGTPVPSQGDLPPGAGGEVQPAVPTAGTSAGGQALQAAVPTVGAGAGGGDTGTPAGTAANTTVAEAPADAQAYVQPNESARQSTPAATSPPVDGGATLRSMLPLFLLALGLVLAVMAWIARRSRPV